MLWEIFCGWKLEIEELVFLSRALFLEIFFDYFMHRPFAPSWRV